MIWTNLALFVIFLIVLLKSADYAIKYSSKLSRALHLQEFIVSFFVIAVVSVLPEATISIMSAIQGDSQLGFGTLLGSNVADLTIVFGIVALFASGGVSGGIKVKSKLLRDDFFYIVLLLFPLLLGFDGVLSRIDGGILVTVGSLFFYKMYRESKRFTKKFDQAKREPFKKSLILLIITLAILLTSALLTVKYAENFAKDIGIPAILIGVTVLALGTCLPELAFSIKAIRKDHDDLALGDVLGTVIADGTILLGIVALINPFSYSPNIMYVLGGAVFLSAVVSFAFMKSEKSINKIEGMILIFFYILFIFVQFFINRGGI
jgi:cation:H+ antiporter